MRALTYGNHIKTTAVIADVDLKLGGGVADVHAQRLRMGVLQRVGDAFLDDAQERQLRLRWQGQGVAQTLRVPAQGNSGGFQAGLHAKTQVAQGQRE